MNRDCKDLNPIRLILCDDQLIVAEAVREILSAQSCIDLLHVVTIEELKGVLDSFQPTIILQDLVLADGSGIDVVRYVRGEDRYRDIPIILLSTTEDAQTKFEAFEAGASDYVVKFPEPYELIGRISYHSRAYCNLREREKAERALHQKSRLESLGNLAAGVAHEINTPLQYISANMSYLSNIVGREGQALSGAADIVDAIRETVEGVEQISLIVRAMKAFAHPGRQEHVPTSINEILSDVRTLSRNEWKEHAVFDLVLDPSLPLVPCAPGTIAQVILNIVVNAAHAIKLNERNRAEPGRIELFSRIHGSMVEVEIRDNGGGIPENVQDKVFEPYFTTKNVGEGSGQGLALAKASIVDGHKGELVFETLLPVGTSFFVRIPHQSALMKQRSEYV